ncbi:MAG: hypothetical protein ABSF97_07580 [Candidatus Sulfotelmatobacter sp.]
MRNRDWAKKQPPWFKVAAAFLEDHPIPIIGLLADRLQQREKAKREALAAKTQRRQGRPLQERPVPVKSQELTSKIGVVGRASLSLIDVPVASRRVSPSERIESSDRKMITSVTEQEKPMKADKGQFDEVLRRMIEKNPKKTAEIAAQNEDDARTRKFRRKRNPETDPQKIAEFNLDRKHPPIKH